jgi:hypothetical protein
VIVHDSDIDRIAVLPTKTDAPLVIDSDAALALSVTSERL